MSSSKMKRAILTVFSIVLAVAIAGAAFSVVLGIIYKTDSIAEASLEQNSKVNVLYTDNYISFTPRDGADTAFIFYPGCFITYEAYAPFMQELALRGMLAIVVDMPLSCALLDISAADSVIKDFPEIDHWYIGGHSLGGVCASKYVAKTTQNIEGLVLLASYPDVDLTGFDIKCLSIYGTNDSVLNFKKYDENKKYLPAGTEEVILEGGNHSQFGNYGGQVGDTRATMTAEEQLDITADSIVEMAGVTKADTVTEETAETDIAA